MIAGLVAGGVLAFAAMAWVVAPLFQAAPGAPADRAAADAGTGAPGAQPPADDEPPSTPGSA